MLRLTFVLGWLFACGDNGPGGSAGVDASIDSPAEVSCGGEGGGSCPADQYCEYVQNGCGAADETGICKPRPENCPDITVAEPVCGCDNQVYASACDAYAAGADLNSHGSCAVPTGAFRCGYRQCDLDTQYCQRATSDVGGEPDSYTCPTLPASCPSQQPTCGCLTAAPCGEMCTGDAATGLTVTCLGG